MSNKAVVLVDFDNVFSTLWELDGEAAFRFASDPDGWLRSLSERYLNDGPRRWLVARCYFNPSGWVHAPGEPRDRLYFSRFRIGLVRAGFDVVDCPSISRGGKNAADIRIVIDALDLLGHRTRFDEFVIASGDSDFMPLLQRIRAEDRRTTVVSPGYLAAAYSASADRIIDFDALRELLRPDDADAVVQPPAGTDAQTDVDYGPTDFADFVRRRYLEAGAPLEMAALARDVDRALPSARADEWGGRGSFLKAVMALDLPHARFSQHHLWDEERHQAPPGTVGDHDEDLPSAVALIVRSLDVPRLSRVQWPKVFETIATYADSHQFNLTEASAWCRDSLSDDGLRISRVRIGFVIRGVQFGGLRLDAATSPTPDDVGRAFLASVIARAASLGILLDEEAERAIAEWFVLRD